MYWFAVCVVAHTTHTVCVVDEGGVWVVCSGVVLHTAHNLEQAPIYGVSGDTGYKHALALGDGGS